jgi:hypothetical protein
MNNCPIKNAQPTFITAKSVKLSLCLRRVDQEHLIYALPVSSWWDREIIKNELQQHVITHTSTMCGVTMMSCSVRDNYTMIDHNNKSYCYCYCYSTILQVPYLMLLLNMIHTT